MDIEDQLESVAHDLDAIQADAEPGGAVERLADCVAALARCVQVLANGTEQQQPRPMGW